MQNKRTHIVFLLACMTALTTILGLAAHATPFFPWETRNPVRAALTQQEGQTVVCEATVARIAARNNPPYFVLRDEFRANNEPERRIVVLCRPPLNLTGAVRVTGVIGRLPGNNEPCILNPTVEGLFDQQGRPLSWTPFPEFTAAGNWRVLPIPAGVIPSCDPSLVSADTGMGIPGEVTAYATEGEVAQFDTVASLLAAAPPVLSRVELDAKPIVSVNAEEGYIVAGDDNDGSTVKIYTNNPAIKTTDRLIKATGVVHSEGGQLCLYAGNGISPFFDSQGPDAACGVSIASPGSVAYAGSLKDATSSCVQTAGVKTNGVSILSVNPPSTTDNSWVYLTGQIVTGVGSYRPYDPQTELPGDAVNVYYVQGLDRTPGIRVWKTDNTNVSVNAIVDIMAQVTTRDGERMLGIPGTASSTDTVVFDNIGNDKAPRPVFMNNKALGGGGLGSNPSVTGGVGLYNIGSSVVISGKVVGMGTYYSDWWNYVWEDYTQLDDGSSVSSPGSYLASLDQNYNVGSDTGVIVFGSDWNLSIGDYATASGISSVWAGPGGTAYRAILLPTITKIDPNSTPSTPPSVTQSGAITLDTKVYGTPGQDVTVNFYASNGGMNKLAIHCDNTTGIGSGSLTWTGFPKTLSNSETPAYTISAKCEGFKTRVYPSVVPDNSGSFPKVRLVPLRKITLEASTYDIDPCSSNTATLTAKVVDADNVPVYPCTVKFYTDQGTFASNGTEQHVIQVSTDTNGQAQATLNASYAWSGNYAYPKATDDLTTPIPSDSAYSDDTYNFDWQPLKFDSQWRNYITIAGYQPTMTVTPANAPAIKIKRCEDLAVTADVQACGTGAAGAQVRFQVSGDGTINEGNGSQDYTATAGSNGIAVVHIHPTTLADPTQSGYISLTVSATSHGVSASSQGRSIEVAPYSPIVTMSANPMRINGPGDVTISFTATNLDGTPRSSLGITVGATANGSSIGTFTGYANNPTSATITNGALNMTLHLTQLADPITVTGTFNDDCSVVGSRTLTKTIRYVERAPWIQNPTGISVGWSCPLVADLNSDGTPEVAVIARDRVDYSSETYSGTSDGRIYIWDSNGVLKWTSKDINGNDLPIDGGSGGPGSGGQGGNNTLSTADIDNRGGLEICAPHGSTAKVSAYGYDQASQTFKPLAGWPAVTPYAFISVGAALGDTNLDGTTKVVAGDLSCVVSCWNACGDTPEQSSAKPYGRLWRQLLASWQVGIHYSTPAIGDVHTTTEDSNHIPDVVVGSENNAPFGIWGFAGNEWHDYWDPSQTYRLTSPWNQTNSNSNCYCSPLIADIDGDGANDVVIGDDAGYIWIWKSSNRSAGWQSRKVVSDTDVKTEIHSSPVVANLDGQPCIVFGCNNGKVYAVHANLQDVSGWTGGILLKDGTRPDPEGGFMGGGAVPYGVRCSPIIGNVVTGTSDIQVVVGCIDGSVYAIWKNGTNHTGGWQAAKWQCAQYPVTGDSQIDTAQNTAILSTPTLCSFDNGSTTDMIVGSTDGIYKIHFGSIPFDSTRHPWPTFHHDAARTGCATQPTSTMVSTSIVGRLKTSAGVGIEGATIQLERWTGSAWSSTVPVYQPASGQSETRLNPVKSAGTNGTGNEINEGGFVFNQLTPSTRYRLVITNGTTQTFTLNSDVALPAGRLTQDITW